MKLTIKKIQLINCIDDIFVKLYDSKSYKYLDELFVEKLNSQKPTNINKNFVKPKNVDCVSEIKPVVRSHGNLIEEVEKLSKERVCVICLDRSKNIMFLPCAHLGKLICKI